MALFRTESTASKLAGPEAETYGALAQLADHWGGLSLSLMELSPISAAPLGLEGMTAVRGPEDALIVMRAWPDLEWILTERAPQNPKPQDPFKQFLSHYAKLWAMGRWEPGETWQVAPFRGCSEPDWPKPKPTVVQGVWLEGYPMELRVWLVARNAKKSA